MGVANLTENSSHFWLNVQKHALFQGAWLSSEELAGALLSESLKTGGDRTAGLLPQGGDSCLLKRFFHSCKQSIHILAE